MSIRSAGSKSSRNFSLHSMNAWEDGERIHCELTEFPHPPEVFPNADGSPGRPAEARLMRWTINLAGKTNRTKREPVDDLNSEMPRVDERFAGLPYRHGWYLADIDCNYPSMHDAIAHIDLKTGKRAVRMLDSGMLRASRSSWRGRPPRRKAMATSSPWSIARRPIPANS